MSKSLHKPYTSLLQSWPLSPGRLCRRWEAVLDRKALETTNQGSKPQSLCTTWSWALSSSAPQYRAPTGEKVSGTLGAGRHAHGRRCIPGLMLSLAQLTSGLGPLESSRLLPGTLRIAHLQTSAHLRNLRNDFPLIRTSGIMANPGESIRPWEKWDLSQNGYGKNPEWFIYIYRDNDCLYLFIVIPMTRSWYPKQPWFFMDGNCDFLPFFHGKDLVHHPIETTICKWIAIRFQVVNNHD